MVNKGATKKWKHKPKLAIFLPKISKNKLEYRIGTYFKIGSGWICLTFVGFQMKNPKKQSPTQFPKMDLLLTKCCTFYFYATNCQKASSQWVKDKKFLTRSTFLQTNICRKRHFWMESSWEHANAALEQMRFNARSVNHGNRRSINIRHHWQFSM